MPNVKIDDTTFHYRLDGPEDRPLVVLSHALSVSHAMWEPQIPVLAKHYRVLSYDMRGHGKTDRTRGHAAQRIASGSSRAAQSSSAARRAGRFPGTVR